MINQCLRIATKAHDGQYRKFTNEPYVNHPIRMSEQLDTEPLKCIALLHDVIEDTEYTMEDLLEMNVPKYVVEVVKILTRTDETYLEFIINCSKNVEAKLVKIEDLKDNLSNLPNGSMRDKYELALHILEGVN